MNGRVKEFLVNSAAAIVLAVIFYAYIIIMACM